MRSLKAWRVVVACVLFGALAITQASEDDAPFAACWGLGQRTLKTAGFTVTATDRGAVFDCRSGGGFTVNLPAGATIGSGFHFAVYNSGAGSIVLDPNGAESIQTGNGASAATVTLQGGAGQGCVLTCNGNDNGGVISWQIVSGSGMPTSGFATPLLTGDVTTATGYATQVATISANVVDSTKLTASVRAVLPTTVAALTDAATIATDCSLGSTFDVTLGGNRTLGSPTGMVNGQVCYWRIKQDATPPRTLAYNAVFRFSATYPSPTLTNAANVTDIITAKYNTTAVKWDVIGISLNYP